MPLLSLPPHFSQTTLIAHHEEGRWVGAAHEVVEIEWFPDDEDGTTEGVAGLEL